MKLKSLLPALALFLPISSMAEESLFNGKNLDQWRIDSKSKATHWTVKDGTIHCQSDPKKAGSLLWTTKDFTDFTLTLEFKNGGGTIDSGVMLKRAKDQIQIGISGSLKRDLTASPYIPGKGLSRRRKRSHRRRETQGLEHPQNHRHRKHLQNLAQRRRGHHLHI